MLVQESLVGETLHYKDMYDTMDESEETLSFCDLPLYSDWDQDDLSSESLGSSSISSSEQDYFEFISQELCPYTPPENIVFCGKLIPYKQVIKSTKKDSLELVESSNKQTNVKKKHSWGVLFNSKFNTTKQVRSKSCKKGTTLVQKSDQSQTKKHEKSYESPVHKMSILTSISSSKAKWFLFFFGSSRLSTRVELRDIKSRQSQRRSPSVRFPIEDDTRVKDSGSGLSGLIRILSCGGSHHPNTMVATSIR